MAMTSSRSYQSFSLRNNTNDAIHNAIGVKERETAVGVEKSGRTFSLKLDWQLRQEEHSVA
jgi:hypothetical protein